MLVVKGWGIVESPSSHSTCRNNLKYPSSRKDPEIPTIVVVWGYPTARALLPSRTRRRIIQEWVCNEHISDIRCASNRSTIFYSRPSDCGFPWSPYATRELHTFSAPLLEYACFMPRRERSFQKLRALRRLFWYLRRAKIKSRRSQARPISVTRTNRSIELKYETVAYFQRGSYRPPMCRYLDFTPNFLQTRAH